MSSRASASIQVPCAFCPLRAQPAFRDFDPVELEFVHRFKRGERRVNRGESVLVEGESSQHLYTVLTGWGFRYKLLADGRRQIVNYVMPGDLVGLQGTLMGEMQHSVEALSPMVLCVFDRDKLYTLYQKHPSLAYDVTWIASREECMLDENLLSIGRRSAAERVAYLIAFLADRARGTGLADVADMRMPITQQHVADTLGLSLVHTNRTIRNLVARRLISWGDRGCSVVDRKALEALAHWTGGTKVQRPFI